MNIRTIIADDESRARKGLLARLKEYPAIHIIGECSTGQEAVDAINAHSPELVFLDIQMPGMNGFDVLQHIAPGNLPIIVFVTAYNEYAIKAFEHHAFDYILKPIDEERLRKTIHHISDEVAHRNIRAYGEKIEMMLKDYSALLDRNNDGSTLSRHRDRKYVQRFMIKSPSRITIVSAEEIYWIESTGDLVHLHTRDKKYIYRKTMVALEEELDPKQFIRVHRSAIVNIAKVKQLYPVSHGDFDIQLENEIKLRLSRTHRPLFQEALEKH